MTTPTTDRDLSTALTLRGIPDGCGRWSDDGLLEAVVTGSPLALYVVDDDGLVQLWNPGAERLYGWTADEVLGRPLPIIGPEHRREFARLLRNARRGVPTIEHETFRSHKDGTRLAVAISTVPLASGSALGHATLGVSQDIGERKAAEAALQHRVRTDALTGVESRTWFIEQLDAELELPEARGGLIHLDVANFEAVNDTYGQDVGDQLLRMVADRLRSAIRTHDRVGRVGGDEFAIAVADADADAVVRVATRVLRTFEAPFRIGSRNLAVRALAGGVHFEAPAALNDVMRAAHLALCDAQAGDDASFRLYDDAVHTAMLERLAVERQIRGATAAGEMVLHYQPIVDVATGRLTGAEALVRWNHPELGLVPPARFIPAAEVTGEIIPLGHWVTRQACLQARAWLDRHPELTEFTMSVNLSSSQLRDQDLPARIGGILEETGLAADRLQIEITESVLAANDAPERVHRLRDLGVSLAVDDFGTGYSSLTALRRFPFTTLKIDQSFVQGSATSSEDHVIVAATIALARSLGLVSVAEGVETDEQLQVLVANGCVEAQGYLFGRPVPAEELSRMLDRWTPAAG